MLDHQTPWVRSLFLATPPEVRVDLLGVLNVRERQFHPKVSLGGMFRSQEISPSQREGYVWTVSRLRRLTRWWLAAVARVRGLGRPDVVVVTNPFGLHLLDAFPRSRWMYYVHDPFEYYQHWDRQQVRRLEQGLLERCGVVTAVSRRLQQDLAERGGRTVHYLPNAARSDWLKPRAFDRPADLPTGKPVVGCIGQLNGTYDWELIEALARRRPELAFVLVGPNVEGDAAVRQAMDNVFSLSNVTWLGARPHDSLRSYMQWFDICFCPLRVNDQNDRRSPLRLYDYLTTDLPVLSTNIAEAREHLPHLLVAEDVDACDRVLVGVVQGTRSVDVAARRAYMARQTWEARAGQLISILTTPPDAAAADERWTSAGQ